MHDPTPMQRDSALEGGIGGRSELDPVPNESLSQLCNRPVTRPTPTPFAHSSPTPTPLCFRSLDLIRLMFMNRARKDQLAEINYPHPTKVLERD